MRRRNSSFKFGGYYNLHLCTVCMLPEIYYIYKGGRGYTNHFGGL